LSQSDCLFCGIVAGRVPADLVLEGDRFLAFRDIDPKAPTHVLVIPREHLTSLDHADGDWSGVLGELLLAARDVARAEGVADDGYRTVVNTGDNGGQSVGHLHLHVLGGRRLTWPPG
jgi:histidine triad (HIT) family protein